MDKIMKMLKELRPEFDFSGSDDFIEDGYLDSFDVTTLVSELEDEFGCFIVGTDVRSENFSSVEAIVELVKKSGGVIE